MPQSDCSSSRRGDRPCPVESLPASGRRPGDAPVWPNAAGARRAGSRGRKCQSTGTVRGIPTGPGVSCPRCRYAKRLPESQIMIAPLGDLATRRGLGCAKGRRGQRRQVRSEEAEPPGLQEGPPIEPIRSKRGGVHAPGSPQAVESAGSTTADRHCVRRGGDSTLDDLRERSAAWLVRRARILVAFLPRGRNPSKRQLQEKKHPRSATWLSGGGLSCGNRGAAPIAEPCSGLSAPPNGQMHSKSLRGETWSDLVSLAPKPLRFFVLRCLTRLSNRPAVQSGKVFLR